MCCDVRKHRRRLKGKQKKQTKSGCGKRDPLVFLPGTFSIIRLFFRIAVIPAKRADGCKAFRGRTASGSVHKKLKSGVATGARMDIKNFAAFNALYLTKVDFSHVRKRLFLNFCYYILLHSTNKIFGCCELNNRTAASPTPFLYACGTLYGL